MTGTSLDIPTGNQRWQEEIPCKLEVSKGTTLKDVFFRGGDGKYGMGLPKHYDLDRLSWEPLARPRPRICRGERGSGNMRKDSVGAAEILLVMTRQLHITNIEIVIITTSPFTRR